MKKLLCVAIVALSLVGGAGRASADPGIFGSAGVTWEDAGVTWEGAGPSLDAGVIGQ
jgi:hypothetical protein